ncbi:hypothetical protein ACFWBN_13200 [Streptomyces sp. NPDC059989]|uniref:hypothetical protein n=1 Tax=Streptomyces sp. NPDC059989 TaxID=3347026 RepID=UPI0036C3420C
MTSKRVPPITSATHEDTYRRVARLRYVTGFATTYGEEADPRVPVFARIWHVQRVASVAKKLCSMMSGLDRARLGKLTWWHDLNRWPFAHNAEKGNFDQAENVREYFSSFVDCTERDLTDLQGIHTKDSTALTDEARVVLVADLLTGIIEDPLMAVAGLNVNPRFIPSEVEETLGFSLHEDPWRRPCVDLATEFHGADHPSPARFQQRFTALFDGLVKEVLLLHRCADPDDSLSVFADIAQTVRETFIRPVIFPLNNEKICHASWLRQEVLPWYFEHVADARQRLLQIDERGFVAEVVGIPGSPYASHQFHPDVGYVSREEPEMAFIRG